MHGTLVGLVIYQISSLLSGGGFGIALLLTIFFCPLATYIILLILSGKTPACTDGAPTFSAPQSDAPTDSVFQ